MNISCVICSDLFIPTAEVYITQCGHMFHFDCLLNWIERSKTCPQCRCKCTEKTIHRVYFNLANTDENSEDVGTLTNKLQNAQFKLLVTEKDVNNYKKKYHNGKEQIVALRKEVAELESKIKVHESAIHALKDQISYFKSKARDSDKLSEEIGRLKHSIKNMENVQLAIHGTREQVNEMLKYENNTESLAILAATLKKSLLDAERRKHDMEYSLKKAQNDVTKYRREANTLECQNNELSKELQFVKENLEKEKQYLKNKIADLSKKISSGNLDITNTSLNRIISESPVNFNRRPQLSSSEDFLNDVSSPPMVEKVKKIIESDSPYLPVKSSNIAIDYTSILNAKTKIGSKNSFTIFKSAAKPLEIGSLRKSNSDVVYNGLGSSSKEDVYPSPKPANTGLKRHKSSSTVSSNKFKKLGPGPARHKVSSYFSQSSSQ